MTRRVASCWAAVVIVLAIGAPRAEARAPVSAGYEFAPDPASVERYGPAYRYPQAGWIVVHVEGEPYERGYQHGRLLAPEIAQYIKEMAIARSKETGEAWRQVRTLVDALFLRRYDKEYLEEMKGIADGAAAAGAKFEGRALDLLDIVAGNADVELFSLNSALDALPTGLEGLKIPEMPEPRRQRDDHCSAFAAVGPATADGKIVFGHITMFGLIRARTYNVWIDIKPALGHRVMMQTYPGGIQSGMDYYMNDNGLLVAETTLRQTRFDINGKALGSRIRRVLQYADSIDDAVKILADGNNGLYTNEWLLADTKANEIAMFELGTHRTKLWRSSKNEWLAGAEGFYWGCNNAKDLEVRLETIATTEGRPANMVFHPSDRDRKWLELYSKYRGKIDADFGFLAFTTPPLAAFASLDAKFTTTDMARDLKTFAVFGPPRGRTWEPTESELARYPGIGPLVSNDWTVLRSGGPPSTNGSKKAVDLAQHDTAAPNRGENEDPGSSVPDLWTRRTTTDLAAWHGTLLPRTDADTWLCTAFADYERIFAMEKSLKSRARNGKLSADAQDRLDLALFAPKSHYATAVTRLGKDIPLASVEADWKSDEWYQISEGKGVLLLAALRDLVGADRFAELMDDFGRKHAGKTVSTREFREFFEQKVSGKPVAKLFDSWLNERDIPTGPIGSCWSIDSFEVEPEQTIIVYGTRKEAAAQREAGDRLQRSIQRRWSNVTVPVFADDKVAGEDLSSHHVLLVGRPDSNSAVERMAAKVPVRFGPMSFTVRSDTYAHALTSVVAAGENPLNPRYSVVVFSGLSAEATWQVADQPASGRTGGATPILIMPNGGRPKRVPVSAPGGKAPVALDGGS